MSLVTEQQYRNLTGDLRTPTSRVMAALLVAQGVAELRLGRALGYGEYTETLDVWPGLIVYPAVAPLDPDQVGYIDSSSLYVSTYAYSVTGYSRAQVTYLGGYVDGELPVALQGALSLIAHEDVNPSGNLINGAKAVSMGDISVTYETAQDAAWPQGAWSLARRYQRREVART